MDKKVLITSRSFGKISDEPRKILEAAGIEITFRGSDFALPEFEQIIPEYDALIIGAHEFKPELMERCPKLKIICKHGVGLDNIPLEKAKELGIAVTNAPGTNSNAVADLAFGLMLSVARCITATSKGVSAGVWKTAIGTDVCGKTLGLLGFGAIAKCVARRAAGFGMKVLAYDPYVKAVDAEFEGLVTLCGFEQVLEQSDYVSIHLPLNEQTYGMIAAEQLTKMKKGAILINTARGGIVNEADLYQALVSGHLLGAGMDVVEHEPLDPKHPLLQMENVVVTPHIGMYSKEAVGAVSLICARNVANYLRDNTAQHRVV